MQAQPGELYPQAPGQHTVTAAYHDEEEKRLRQGIAVNRSLVEDRGHRRVESVAHPLGGGHTRAHRRIGEAREVRREDASRVDGADGAERLVGADGAERPDGAVGTPGAGAACFVVGPRAHNCGPPDSAEGTPTCVHSFPRVT